MEQLVEIKINRIKITENHRTNIEKTNLDELMQSIKQHGLIQPIGLAKNGKGYKLRFGQRRFLACKKLGYKTIKAMVTDSIEEENLLLENLTENIQRTDPSMAEYGRIIDKLGKGGLSHKEIGVRLGIPQKKVQKIATIYTSLPLNIQKRVGFLPGGAGRKMEKGGKIPANVAISIINMQRRHKLKDKNVESIVNSVSDGGLDASDLENVGSLISSGMKTDDALTRLSEYGVFAIDVVIKHTEVSGLMEEYGLISRKHLFKKVLYGELPPLKKPDWVNTGIRIKKEKETPIVIDKTKFLNMRNELMVFKDAGKLRETQIEALKPTAKINYKKWTEEQCNQIENILKGANDQ